MFDRSDRREGARCRAPEDCFRLRIPVDPRGASPDRGREPSRTAPSGSVNSQVSLTGLVSRRAIETRPLEVTPTGHRTEYLYDDGENDGILVCAAHGGEVEPGTAEAAIELATRLPSATCWAVLGYDDESAFDRWHPPSTAIEPGDYPLLARIADRDFETVVSLHGLAEDGLLVGGDVDAATRELVRDRLDPVVTADARTVSEGEYAGVHPDNFVNWLAAGDDGGLQIEGGPRVRARGSGGVVDALADLLSSDSI